VEAQISLDHLKIRIAGQNDDCNGFRILRQTLLIIEDRTVQSCLVSFSLSGTPAYLEQEDVLKMRNFNTNNQEDD